MAANVPVAKPQPRLSSVLRLAQAPDDPVFDLDKEILDREK